MAEKIKLSREMKNSYIIVTLAGNQSFYNRKTSKNSVLQKKCEISFNLFYFKLIEVEVLGVQLAT